MLSQFVHHSLDNHIFASQCKNVELHEKLAQKIFAGHLSVLRTEFHLVGVSLGLGLGPSEPKGADNSFCPRPAVNASVAKPFLNVLSPLFFSGDQVVMTTFPCLTLPLSPLACFALLGVAVALFLASLCPLPVF